MKNAFITSVAVLFFSFAGIAQNISVYEYFFNTDPGIGNGFPYEINTGDNLDTLVNVDISTLDIGWHKVYFRFRNADGIWSLSEGRTILKANPPVISPEIVAMEYFIDEDPGIGNTTSYSIEQGEEIDIVAENPDMMDVLQNNLENLEFVRNTAGLMSRKIGPVWVNSISDMQPGEGYLVKMNAPDVLVYPEESKTLIINNVAKPEYFIVKNGNPLNPVWTIYFEQRTFETGDEIAVFDGEKLVGSGVINSDNIFENSVPVFSNLYQTSTKPVIKIWNKNENQESVLSDYTFTNPSEGIFNITIEGVSGKVQMKVFDVHGNYHRFLELEGTRNIIIEKLDLTELPAGVYFINFRGKEFSRVKKIVIQ